MINLLPPIEKMKRIQEKRLKLIWVLGILISASLIALGLIFLSIKFYIANQADAYDALIDFEKEKASSVWLLQEKANSINNTLGRLNSFYEKQFVLSGFTERISDLLQPDIYLDSFSYKDDESRITFSGHSSTIDKIYELREKLKAQEDFTNISFTIPDWLRSTDVTFTVTFVLKK